MKINVNANKIQTGNIKDGKEGGIQLQNVKHTEHEYDGGKKLSFETDKKVEMTDGFNVSGIKKSNVSKEIASATTLGSKEEVGGKE